MDRQKAPSQSSHAHLARDPALYDLAPDASGGAWNLFRVSAEFDSRAGDLNESLIERLNAWAARAPDFAHLRLEENAGPLQRPGEILLLDGSPSRLPLSRETARVMSAHLNDLGLAVPVRVLNRREELLARVAEAPRELLVVSQAAHRSLYDATLARVLESRGIVVVPGPLTAPGGPLSNKKVTYELLNGHHAGACGSARRLTADYQVVEVSAGGAKEKAAAIVDAAAALAQEWKTSTFFVKPQEGGGGRGCFRLDAYPHGFSLPDLSKLGVAAEDTLPLPLSFDPENEDHYRAIGWLVHRFRASPATAGAYVKTKKAMGASETLDGNLRRMLHGCAPTLYGRLRAAARPREEAIRLLAGAIENYEQVFDARYMPLICNWIDFGLFGVRVHLRLDRAGPIVESLYARLFPIEFTDDSIGVVGVDSITNRSEGGMELNRYAPLTPALVAYAGGEQRLCEKLRTAFHAFARFLSLLDPAERGRVPVRAEFDLSPLSGLIAEGNADPVRAQCANSRWERFRTNCAQWTEDALAFYSWKSGNFRARMR